MITLPVSILTPPASTRSITLRLWRVCGGQHHHLPKGLLTTKTAAEYPGSFAVVNIHEAWAGNTFVPVVVPYLELPVFGLG